MSDDVKLTAIVVAGVVAVIAALAIGISYASIADTDAITACIEAGNAPMECRGAHGR
jgi:hypothetical protein